MDRFGAEAEADWPEDSESSASGESQWLFVDVEEEGPTFSDLDSNTEDAEQIAANTALDVEPSEASLEPEEEDADSSAPDAECSCHEASGEEEEDQVSAESSSHEAFDDEEEDDGSTDHASEEEEEEEYNASEEEEEEEEYGDGVSVEGSLPVSCREQEEDMNRSEAQEIRSTEVSCCEEEEDMNPSEAREMRPAEATAVNAPAAELLVGGLLLGSSGVLSVGSEATTQWAAALQDFPSVAGAFCLGRLALAGGVGKLPALARAVVLNVGCKPWPDATCLRIVAGNSYGFDVMRVGSLAPGEGADLLLDLAVPEAARTGCGQRSAWVLTDDLGQPFGPLLVLEVVWE